MDNGQQVLSAAFMMEARLFYQIGLGSFLTDLQWMAGHLFQNYDTIYVRFFPTYTCNHSCYTIYVGFFATYTCILSCFVGFLFPSIWPFSYNAHKKSPYYICYTNKHVVYGVHRKSSYTRHRIVPSAKNPFMYDAAKMHVILCSASNFNFIIPSFIKYKLSKAKAGGLYDPWSKWPKLFCVEMNTEG